MKRLLTFLLMALFMVPLMAQNPKVYIKKNKKEGYKEYKIEMEVGGSVKQSDFINTLELNFYYYKHFDGYNDKGQMFFVQRGYDNCIEEIDGKKTIILILKIDNDTIVFKPTYWSVNYWTVNGQIDNSRPDRYYISSFYNIYDSDIQRLLNAKTAIDVIKFGTYENAGWFLSGKNLDNIEYLLNYAETDIKK